MKRLFNPQRVRTPRLSSSVLKDMSTHLAALKFSSRGSSTLFWPLWVSGARVDLSRRKANTHINKSFLKKQSGQCLVSDTQNDIHLFINRWTLPSTGQGDREQRRQGYLVITKEGRLAKPNPLFFSYSKAANP